MDMFCLSNGLAGEYSMTAERLRKNESARDRSGQIVTQYTPYAAPDDVVQCIAGSMATRSRRTVLSEVFRDGTHKYREWVYMLVDFKPPLSDRFLNIKDTNGVVVFDGTYNVTGIRPIMAPGTGSVVQYEVWLERVDE